MIKQIKQNYQFLFHPFRKRENNFITQSQNLSHKTIKRE